MGITHQVVIQPSALAIALPEEHLVLCHEIFGQAGLRVHRTEHVPTACENIAKLLPQVVVTSTALRLEVREMIEDRAVAVGAVLMVLHPDRDYASIERNLRGALLEARSQFGRSAYRSS
jgi:hypothetical protein